MQQDSVELSVAQNPVVQNPVAHNPVAQNSATRADSPASSVGKLAEKLMPSGSETARPSNLREFPGEVHGLTLLESPPREAHVMRLPTVSPASADVPSLLRLVEAEQAERARLLDQLEVEQAANGQMRRLIGQFLAARERERVEWQAQLDAARSQTEAARAEKQQEAEKNQRALTDILTMEERFKTHKTHWIMERRRLEAKLDAMAEERARGRRGVFGFLFGR